MYLQVRQLFFGGAYSIYTRLRNEEDYTIEPLDRELIVNFAKEVNLKMIAGTASNAEIAMVTQIVAILGCHAKLQWFHLDVANALTRGINY